MARIVQFIVVLHSFLVLFGSASAALFAVDLGTEYLKISIVKPGRIPISVVINEMSKRKTPALVAFVNGERLIGEEAAPLSARFPDRVYMGLKDMLGRPHNDEHIQRMIKDKHLPYTIVPGVNSSSLAVATDTGDLYSAEELVASLLEYAKQIAEVAAEGAPTTDCVLTVPSYFTPPQRQALQDAAKLAGLNVMGLIHSHAAAALQYGIERDFTNRTEQVVFYDMGSGTVEAALVKFSSYVDKKGASFSQFEVLDVAWVENLGGDNLEVVLMEHFADQFNQGLGGGADVRASPKAMAKLRNQVKRTKQILSANTEAPISVEELYQDRDFRSSITRTQFEELAGDFWDRAVLPLSTLLSRNNLTAADLDAVELLGGGSRVPRLKQALSEALGGRGLDMHLDGDEACVLGAGLFAANLSTTFRLRKFGMTDKVPYSITLKMEGGGEGEDAAQERVLVPAMKRMPTKRVFSRSNVPSDSLAFSLAFTNEQGALGPGSVQSMQLGEFGVSGIKSVVETYGESGKVSIHTRVDQGGVFTLEGAESVVEVVEVIPETPPVTPSVTANNTNTTVDGSATSEAEESSKAGGTGEEADGKGGESVGGTEGEEGTSGRESGSAQPPSPGPGPAASAAPLKTKKRTVKVPLNITGGMERPGMNEVQLRASRSVLRALREKDRVKRELGKARNDLESYIISMRDKVGSDEGIAKVTTEEQRSEFAKQLDQMEDWLYEEEEAATVTEYRNRLKQLQEVGNPMLKRAAELELRPKAVQVAMDFVELAKKAANTWPDVKPWLNITDIQGMMHKVEELAGWLTGKVSEQEGKALHEAPAFESQEVHSWLERVKKAFDKLNNKKKPRPPPPPPAPANATAGGNGTAAEGASGSAGDENGNDEGETGGEQGDAPVDSAEGTKADVRHEELR